MSSTIREHVMRQHMCNAYCDDPVHCEVIPIPKTTIRRDDFEYGLMHHYRQFSCPTVRFRPAPEAPPAWSWNGIVIPVPDPENYESYLVWFDVTEDDVEVNA